MEKTLNEMLALVQSQAVEQNFSDDAKKELRVCLLTLAYNHNKEAFLPIMSLVSSEAFGKSVQEDDWMMANLHRVLASVIDESGYAAIATGACKPELSNTVREQLVLTINFGWIEGVIADATVVALYKEVVDACLASNALEKRTAMAIFLNVAVIGGKDAKDIETAIFDANVLGEEAEQLKMAIKAIDAQRQRFRDLFKKEHKGFFLDMTAELEHINEPVVEEIPEMPGKGKPIVREAPKVGRNDPCPCGSGKKYKKCCGANKD